MSATRITTSFSFIAAGLLVGACVVKQPMGVGGEIKGEDQQVQNQQPPPAEQGNPPPAQPASTTAPRAQQSSGGVATAGAVIDCTQEYGQDVSPDLGDAKALPDGAIVNGCFTHEDKGDAYKLTAAKNAAGTIYRFRVTVSTETSLCIKLFNQDRERLEQHCPQRGTTEDFWISVGGGGSVYVVAENTQSYRKENRPYTIEVSQRLLQDADEPNDSPSQATRLPLGTPHKALSVPLSSNPDAEKDVYEIEVAKPGTLSIAVVNSPEETHFTADLVNADGERLGSHWAKNKGAALRWDVQVRKAGTHYLVLKWAHKYNSHVANHGELPSFLDRQYEITATMK